MSKLTREIISRSASAILAAALLYGGIKCLSAAGDLANDARQRLGNTRSARRSSGAGLPMMIGVVLILLGGALGLAAVTPTRVFERIIGPPTGTSLYDTPDTSRFGNRRWRP